jgi:predicted amidohydrolase YtcJ
MQAQRFDRVTSMDGSEIFTDGAEALRVQRGAGNLATASAGLLAALALTCAPAQAAERTDASKAIADLVVIDAHIWTGDPSHRSATALATRDGRLLAVGTDAEVRALAGDHTRVIDVHGKGLVPGFIDAHTHFVDGGFELLGADLRLAASRDEFVRRFGEYAAKIPAGRWIRDATWDHERWPGAPLPRRDWIDGVSGEHPVFIQRLDGHMGLANTRALALAGITRDTPDPDGGTIVRDESGEPTGVLKDAAMTLIFDAQPPLSPAEIEDALRAAMTHAAEVGVTSIQDITLWDQYPVMKKLHDAGALTVRIYARTPLATWERQRDAIATDGAGDEWLRFGGFKAFADGSLGSSTAWFFEPYADAPETSGLRADDWFPEGILEQRVAAADAAGLQVSIHAIGERANAEILDLFERVEKRNGARDRRFRIEHAQHLRKQDVPRFAALGVIPSMQPFHEADDGRWADKRLGAERSHDSYVFRSLLASGARLAFGTDWSVAPLDPMLGIAAAVTRQTLDGKNPGGWHQEEKITLEQALSAYTAGSAYAEFAEKDKGTLTPGKLADFVILSDDPYTVPPQRLHELHADLTVVGGRVVFERTPAH